MTAALLDRLTHRCEIFEMNAESYRFRESMKAKKRKTPRGVSETIGHEPGVFLLDAEGVFRPAADYQTCGRRWAS